MASPVQHTTPWVDSTTFKSSPDTAITSGSANKVLELYHTVQKLPSGHHYFQLCHNALRPCLDVQWLSRRRHFWFRHNALGSYNDAQNLHERGHAFRFCMNDASTFGSFTNAVITRESIRAAPIVPGISRFNESTRSSLCGPQPRLITLNINGGSTGRSHLRPLQFQRVDQMQPPVVRICHARHHATTFESSLDAAIASGFRFCCLHPNSLRSSSLQLPPPSSLSTNRPEAASARPHPRIIITALGSVDLGGIE